ncbi:MAG: hypothetical protein ACYC0U_00975 [Ilumatobacteraceae bacterium]
MLSKNLSKIFVGVFTSSQFFDRNLDTTELHGYTSLRNHPQSKGARMVSTADMSEVNRLEHFMSEDLDPKWNEPSTRGDLRLLAIRIDTKFEQLRGDFRLHTSEIDSKFEQLRGDFRNLASEINSKFDKFHGGWILFGAIMTANLAMFGIFATLIK